MALETIDLSGFTILRKIGTGARSIIYLAKDEQSGDKIALKRAVLEKPEDSRIFEQIETEYKIAKQIDHPYVRKCYKFIKKRKLMKTNEVLLTMEYFDGETLENSRGLSLVDCCLVFRMVATALNAMHAAGIIHCDLKPNNIMIDKDGQVRIIDLGQSCKVGTIKQRIQGTPDYIAPEQVHRQRLDYRTDIFNLGATMYWAFTGKNIPTLIPQQNDSLGLDAMNHRKQFKTPHQMQSRINPGISKLIMDCIEEKPADRPASMSEVVSRLDLHIHNIFGNKRNNNHAGTNA